MPQAAWRGIGLRGIETRQRKGRGSGVSVPEVVRGRDTRGAMYELGHACGGHIGKRRVIEGVRGRENRGAIAGVVCKRDTRQAV